MVEVKTSQLSGAALDWAFLIAIQETPFNEETLVAFFNAVKHYRFTMVPKYSTDWSQGGPLIEKYRIEFSINEDTYEVGASLLAWRSYGKSHRTRWSKGSSHLIAACRAIVAAKLGDTVSVPAELLTNG